LTTLNSNTLAEVRLNFAQSQSFDNPLPKDDQDSFGFTVSYDDLDADNWNVARYTPEIKWKEKMQKHLQKLGDVVESVFASSAEMVGTLPLDDLPTDLISEPEVSILRISDLEDGFVKSDISRKGNMKKEIADSLQQEFLADNDIIISNKGTIGKTAIYKADGRLILPSPQLFVIKANTKKIYPKYLFKVLNSKFVQDKLKSLTTGAYIPRLSKKDLKNIVIPVPPKKQQHSEDYLKLLKERSKMKKAVQEINKKIKEFDI